MGNNNLFIQSVLKKLTSTYVIVLDLEGKYLFVNDAFYGKFSFISDSFIGKSFTDSVHEDDILSCIKLSEKCIQNKDSWFQINLRKPVSSNGLFCSSSWEFKHIEFDNIEAILCIGSDITELQESISHLQSAKYVTESLFNNTNEGCFIVDKDLSVFYQNKMAIDFTSINLNVASTIGKSIFDFFPQEFLSEIKLLLSHVFEGNSHCFEKQFNNKWWLIKLLPIFSYENIVSGFSLFLSDITDKKMVEEKLKAQVKFLDDIAWKQSHEVRGPLSNILGIVRILSDESHINDKDFTQKDYLNLLEKSATELDNIITKIVKEAYFVKHN